MFRQDLDRYTTDLFISENDPCNSNPCQNGNCSKHGLLEYRCLCSQQYTGKNCKQCEYDSIVCVIIRVTYTLFNTYVSTSGK